MHTTTVRYDPETWSRVKLRAEELSVPTADYIRVATIQRLERAQYEERILAIEEVLERLARVVGRIARRVGLTTRGADDA